MWFMIGAIAAGVIAGRVRGGRLTGVAGAGIRWLPLLLLAIAVQLAPEALGLTEATPLVLASFALLGLFGIGNRHLVGMPIFLLGLGLNLAVVVVNDGMPVRPGAVVGANIATADQLGTIDLGPRRHFETADDELTFLGDIVPIPPLREVVSFGDLIMAVGIADIVANVMLPRRRRRIPLELEPLHRSGGADWIDLREQERLAAAAAAVSAPPAGGGGSMAHGVVAGAGPARSTAR